MTQVKVLITVPHFTCSLFQENHLCDYGARNIYPLLSTSLTIRGFNVLVARGNVNRRACKYCDLNRKESRGLPYRKVVTETLKDGEVSFLFDLHSFPPETKEWGKYELVVVTSKRETDPTPTSFTTFLTERKVKVSLLYTDVINDLIDQAESLGINSLLLEFNEGLTLTRAKQICDLVAAWSTYLLSNGTRKGKRRKAGSSTKSWSLLVHGGASNLPPSKEEEEVLEEAAELGASLLREGKTSLQVVERVVSFLENSGTFNAGKGERTATTSEGTYEFDASIMDGRTLKHGSVTGSKSKNPVGEAKEVLGADNYNTLCLRENKEKRKVKGSGNSFGTVGCVARDSKGNLSTATSTGGLQGKVPGRVGDSAILGAGFYANNETCALACTGIGEVFITYCAAYDVHARIKYAKESLRDAVDEVVQRTLPKGAGGMVGVDKEGGLVVSHTTKYLLHSYRKGS